MQKQLESSIKQIEVKEFIINGKNEEQKENSNEKTIFIETIRK